MAKQKSIETLDFFYLNTQEQQKEDKKKKTKKKVKKESKTNNKKGAAKTALKEKSSNKDVFNFDNEIVIGVTKLPDNKNEKRQPSKKQERQTKQKAKEKGQAATRKKASNVQNKKGTHKRKTPTKLTKEQLQRKRRNKIIKFFIKWFVLLSLLIGAILFFLMTPLFNITSIEIVGNETISQEEIISLSQVQLYENTFKISKKETSQKIKENAYIESVRIIRKLPSTLVIEVTERKATYKLAFVNGYVFMNNQGYILEISEKESPLITLTGINTAQEQIKVGNRLDASDLEKLDTVLKITDAANNNEIASLITKIDITDKEDYIIYFDSEDKIVYIGNGTNLGDRMRKIKKMLELETGISGEYYINMDLNTKKPYFRQRV